MFCVSVGQISQCAVAHWRDCLPVALVSAELRGWVYELVGDVEPNRFHSLAILEIDMPPTNNTEIIRTTGDVQIVLSDAGPSITLQTPTGSMIVIGASDINIEGAGGRIRIANGVISIDAAIIRLESAMVTARTIRCETLVAESVISNLYSPGVGNLM